MRRFSVSVLSVLCVFAGLAGSALAQNPNLRPDVTLSPASLSFDVAPGHSATAAAVLSNHSGLTVNVSKIKIDSTCSSLSNCGAQFRVVSHGCGASLKDGDSCTINVEFDPTSAVETAHATLKVTVEDANLQHTEKVALTGVSRP